MKRRKFVGSALTAGAIGAVSVAAEAKSRRGREDDDDDHRRLPRGRPFVQIVRRIEALEEQVASGEFEQIRIDAEQGPDQLLFGPTDDCRISVDPDGPGGLLLRDPGGIRILNPDRAGPDALLFGPTQDCRISVDPGGPGGLLLTDPGGIRILSPDDSVTPTLLFGPTNDCGITADAGIGLIIVDPEGLVVSNPIAGAPNVLSFGLPAVQAAANQAAAPVRCRILAGGLDANGGPLGMIFEDPENFLFRNPLGGESALAIGAPECRLLTGALGPDGQRLGLILEDPGNFLFRNPASGETAVAIGAQECRIVAGEATGALGMIFEDPRGFQFENQVRVNGAVFAQEFIQESSGALKENVRPIENPLDVINGLTGVHFDWKDGGRPDIGFIGEDVERLLPQLVRREPGEGGVKGVKYANMVAVAVEGIKAQQSQIRALEEQNTVLREQIDSLRDALDAIAARVAPGTA